MREVIILFLVVLVLNSSAKFIDSVTRLIIAIKIKEVSWFIEIFDSGGGIEDKMGCTD